MNKYRNSGNRPWWWIFNPWLYAMRRDHAYEEALDSLTEISIDKNPAEYTPENVSLFEFVAGHCPSCSRQYAKELIERKSSKHE